MPIQLNHSMTMFLRALGSSSKGKPYCIIGRIAIHRICRMAFCRIGLKSSGVTRWGDGGEEGSPPPKNVFKGNLAPNFFGVIKYNVTFPTYSI